MAVIQVDAQMSIPHIGGYLDRYYWTWVSYFDVADPTVFHSQIDGWMENSCRTRVTSTVRYDGYVVTYPVRSGIRLVNRLGQNLAGRRTSGVVMPLENVMRMSLLSDNRVVGYRLWRAGFLDVDYVGQEWEPTILSQVRAVALVPIAGGYNCGLRGDIITDVRIDPVMHIAGLRHGTKRVGRKVLT